jgi:hypothetical protein
MPSLVARFDGVDPRPGETSAIVPGKMAGTEVIGMVGKTRDRIVVESEKVGQPAREGEILEIIEASYGTRYRVMWDDGHESTFRPAAGSAKVIPAPKQRPK